jgi:phosphoinositide-3-kinase regulatory subunit 4
VGRRESIRQNQVSLSLRLECLSNLASSTRPYLNELEKRWIAFQVISAMRDARAREVSHGDIKSENILIDPSLNVHLTDFASAFKPTYLPLNDPSDFSYFYDSSGRRTCYIAPERFYTDDSKIAAEKRSIQAQATSQMELGGASGSASWIGGGIGKRDGKVTEEMDVFSIGCSLLEMWTDGASVFTLSELYSYREGQTAAVDTLLNSLEDETVKVRITGRCVPVRSHCPYRKC